MRIKNLTLGSDIQDGNAHSRMKVALVITGYAPRSLSYTEQSIKTNIINPLEENGHFVRVFLYSFISKKGGSVSRGDQNSGRNINTRTCFRRAKKAIVNQDNLTGIPNSLPGLPRLNSTDTTNHLRDLYQEAGGIQMVPEGYDVVIMIGPDMLILTPINIHHLAHAAREKILYTSGSYNWGGIANKFCIGQRDLVKIVASRLLPIGGELKELTTRSKWIEFSSKLMRGEIYESPEHLYAAFLERSGIKTKKTSTQWCKVRAGGFVRKPQIRNMVLDLKKIIKANYPNIKVIMCNGKKHKVFIGRG